MKKILIFLTMLFSMQFLLAQTVNGIPLKDLDVNYLRIYGSTNFSGTKMVVRFEFGQRIRFADHKNKEILDANGKRITFNTMIDALNFISQYGYRLIQTYPTANGSKIYYHYIMEKIGLIDNKGINQYENNQNSHYNRSLNNQNNNSSSNNYQNEENYNNEPQSKREEFEQKRREQMERMKSKNKENSAKIKGAFDKVSDAFKKKENRENTPDENDTEFIEEENKTQETTPEETFVSCTQCSGSGKINTTCQKDNCQNGKTTQVCSACDGKYTESNSECYKCEGLGCEYCDFDGKACDACKNGKKSSSHAHCNGTGKVKNPCNHCKGTGQIKQ